MRIFMKVAKAEGAKGGFFCFGIKGNWTWWRLKHAFSLLLASLKTWRMGFSVYKCFRKSWGR